MQATDDKTYNGWTNYGTWAVGMFLDGNYTGEGTYRYVLEMAQEAKDESAQRFQGRDNVTIRILADRIEEFVKESMPDLGASLAADILGAALSEVNWFELAENKLSEF